MAELLVCEFSFFLLLLFYICSLNLPVYVCETWLVCFKFMNMEKKFFLRCLMLLFCVAVSLNVSSQVPSTMDYQLMAIDPTTGKVLANTSLSVRVELLLNSENGEIVWIYDGKVTSSQAGICTIGLDFRNVDWSKGAYFLKAYVNGSPLGASQVKSVPFALCAASVDGVVTKDVLCGTWLTKTEEKDYDPQIFVFKADGTFSYGYDDDELISSGRWKVNNLGFVTFDITEGSKTGRKYVAFSVYDKEELSLCLGGCDAFLGDNVILWKQ